ncbi:uncharacterized protein LOC111829417 [Capsella rubella]|uniref:uncharacterized protein LOC111829417 n=1 Tax=Capsella rubella TaxID=81985 RepID=UPI000CD58C75|nr:uncharacterized protein LOC111829417 [Capsella rubella]
MEDPLDHLDEFDRMCGLTKINGVSEDGFKLRLFPFSLGDKAHQWEKSLPAGSITTWEECKKAFLSKFFSNARTARLRNDISSFSQRNNETFYEAWERFKSYKSYNGNFLNKDVEASWELVENLAQSDGTYNEDYDRTVRGNNDQEDKYKRDMKALNDKLDKFLMNQQKNVHFVREEETFQPNDGDCANNEEFQNKPYVGFNQKQAFQPQQQSQGSYQQPISHPPGFQQHPTNVQPEQDIQTTLHQLLQAQNNSHLEHANQLPELRNEMSESIQELHQNFDSLNKRVVILEGNKPSTSSGQLPGKSIMNPKEFATAHAITLGKPFPIITEDSEVQEGEDSAQICTLHGEPDRVYNRHDRSNGEPDRVYQRLDRSDQRYHEPDRARYRVRCLSDRLCELSSDEPLRPIRATSPKPSNQRLLYPEESKAEIKEEYNHILDSLSRNDQLKALVDAFANLPSYREILKEVLLERMQQRKSWIPPSQDSDFSKKIGDPGAFTLPCSIRSTIFNECLCDTGASISLMPLSIAHGMG